MIQAKVSFLLGAGASCDAGLPHASQLTEKLRNALLERVYDDSPLGSELAYADLLAIYRFIVGGIRFNEGVHDRSPDESINIEQIAITALELADRSKSPLASYIAGWHERIRDFEQKSQNWAEEFLRFMYHGLSEWLAVESDETVSYLARTADFSREWGYIDIFSLNYDLCVERALTNVANLKFNNGFTEFGWDGEEINREVKIRLIKLHGSLDWIDDPNYGICALEYPRHRDAEDIESDKEPLLVFGTANKLSGRQPFLDFAYQFSRSVSGATILIIIGYSFGDSYVNMILEQGMLRNDRLRVIVVSPSAAEDVSKLVVFREHPRVKTIGEGAADSLNRGTLLKVARELVEDSAADAPF